MHIAYIFDEERNIKTELTSVLNQARFKTRVFSDPNVFLEALRARMPSQKVIFICLNSSLHKGFQIIKRLSEFRIPESLPVIVTSYDAHPFLVEEIGKQHCYFVLTATLSESHLAAILSDFYGRKHILRGTEEK